MRVVGASNSMLRNRRVIDGAVAAGVFAYNLPIQGFAIPGDAVSWMAYLLPIGLCLPYLFHRRFPRRMFGFVLATAYLQLGLGVGLLVADVMVVLALYSVARTQQWTSTLPAAAAVMAWVVAVTAPSMDEYAMSYGDIGLLVLTVATAWLLGVLSRVRNEYVRSLELRAQQMEREQEAQTREAAAAERTRIAREIHDIVSHSLSAIVLLSDGAAATARTDPEQAVQAMISVRDTGRDATTEMRSMLTVLYSDAPMDRAPQPGLAQLADLFEQSRAVGIAVDYAVHGCPVDLQAGLQLVIYRVVQEALTNVRKHAGPQVRTVRVDLTYTGADVEVTVFDDGRGSASPGGDGWGLMGMRERVAAQGGTMCADATGSGFRVAAHLPIESAP